MGEVARGSGVVLTAPTKSNTPLAGKSTARPARFNAALEELRSQIAPLQQRWIRAAVVVYPVEQLKWHQAATALNEILVDLGNVIRAGAEEVANTDRRSGGVWAG
ncbi:hypothetical protein JK2ML_0363 [Mycobacterium leprae Kyoto-2]|uniref:ESAT-6-like protein n=3 Tax=Mycobacterium leprae TaxID=1769 RepID=Q9CCV7_MYCLE|nr:WXG100 family type VII secretion target [Mycobacterium leprae]OAR21506.1 hypothetical protein A8144_05705 [Mycobacterium leprae 3125609]OAX71445.1 hypothetical protein A3216_05850 [Mycobacterium leprae 7935681]CAR70456.1 possible secreted protein [Mycobacterium leprae Br4923]BBC16522.1 hypothetical protein JK2ML_0363 [Mycobacterium leprae Kyoto-2]